MKRTDDWYYRFQYPQEKERGLDFEEDLFQPFALNFDLRPNEPVRVIVSTDPVAGRDVEELIKAERARRMPSSTELLPALQRAAEAVPGGARSANHGDCGLPLVYRLGSRYDDRAAGLALETEQSEVFRRVVLAFLPWFRRGLLPNRFPDAGAAPEYNSTDATLWFVEALRAYVDKTGDYGFIREQCFNALRDVIAWRERGTLYGIRIDDDGLLTGGEAGVQLTWMDAKVGDRVITERAGKPVEIQALWYNALCIIQEFAGRFGDNALSAKCAGFAERAREASINSSGTRLKTACSTS